MKNAFVTKEQLEAIAAQYPTPFYLYDEKGIRENARRLRKAFAWNPGYREYFAVKATPTPGILKLLYEEGCGCDVSSMAELLLAERCGVTGKDVMFSSNNPPADEFQKADELGAIINLDDLTLVDTRTGDHLLSVQPRRRVHARRDRRGLSGHGHPRRGQIRHDASPACASVP